MTTRKEKSMELTLESLGLSKTEIEDRVVAKIAASLMVEDAGDTDFANRLSAAVQVKIDEAVKALATQHVLPNIAAYVEATCLQATNQWGERRGTPMTFTEYLVAKADAYLREEVNYEGKPKGADGYSAWTKSGTRIAYMIHKHLQYSIQQAMEQALKTANSSIVGGIEEAVKIKLGEVAASLRVKTEIGQ